jgi:hypothetical protein
MEEINDVTNNALAEYEKLWSISASDLPANDDDDLSDPFA